MLLEKKTIKMILDVMDDIKIREKLSPDCQDETLIFFKNNDKIDSVPARYYNLIVEDLIRNRAIEKIKKIKNGFCGSIINTFFNNYQKRKEEDLKLFENIGKTQKHLFFNEEKSILAIGFNRILISRQKQKTIAHLILDQLFNNDNDYKIYYSELSENISGTDNNEYNSDKKYWNSFYTGCKDIQEKIRKKSNNSITDFLDFNTGFKGRVLINKKYINKDK